MVQLLLPVNPTLRFVSFLHTICHHLQESYLLILFLKWAERINWKNVNRYKWIYIAFISLWKHTLREGFLFTWTRMIITGLTIWMLLYPCSMYSFDVRIVHRTIISSVLHFRIVTKTSSGNCSTSTWRIALWPNPPLSPVSVNYFYEGI